MIVVCGEALMDVFDAGATASGNALDARIGGSPYNVAMGLARLAQPVTFCGAIATGFLGQRLMRSLADERIDTACVQRSAAPTSVCFVGLDASGVPAYDFCGERGADRQLDAARALAAVPANARAFHFGSYAMVVEPVAAAQRALIEREHARGAAGALIAYDPNVRLVVEPDVARWRETLQWMLTRTHLLKISDEDLGLLYPGLAPEAAAMQWLAQGVRCVVVTRGAAGALAYLRPGARGGGTGEGGGGRYRRRRRHLPGRAADLAGRTTAPVDRRREHARRRRPRSDARLRHARRRHHLLAPRRRSAAAQRAGLSTTARP